MLVLEFHDKLLLNNLDLVKVFTKLANEIGVLLGLHQILNKFIDSAVNPMSQPFALLEL